MASILLRTRACRAWSASSHRLRDRWPRTFNTSGSGSSSSWPQPSSPAQPFNNEMIETSPENVELSLKRTVSRQPIVPFPLTGRRTVPPHIPRPPYADSGIVPVSQYPGEIQLHDSESAERMRQAARLARRTLDLVCSLAVPGVTTDELDGIVHNAIIESGAYPSPLNYAGFPKSLCSSINEVICHGIPDTRPLQFGDVVSFDVSCFLTIDGVGVHGDNCATVIVGDQQKENLTGVDWRGVPYLSKFENERDEAYFLEARRLVSTTKESLNAAIQVCRPGGCLSEVGGAIEDIADREGFSSVRKYRGHGISSDFHCAPFVRHYRNDERVELLPGMIFTIEPMLTQGHADCFEWDDDWTVSTVDAGLAAQFEHSVLITEESAEILTVPE